MLQICKQVYNRADTTVNDYYPEGSGFVVQSFNQLYVRYVNFNGER